METQNENGGLIERTELPPPPPPKKRLGRERQERDMQLWLNLTTEVRANYMAMALTCYGIRSDVSALRKAVELVKMAEMPSVNQF